MSKRKKRGKITSRPHRPAYDILAKQGVAQVSFSELAEEVGAHRAYLSMVAIGQRMASPELKKRIDVALNKAVRALRLRACPLCGQ